MYTHAVDMKGASIDWVVGITELGRCSVPAGEIALLAAMAGSEIMGATEEGDGGCRCLIPEQDSVLLLFNNKALEKARTQ